jgi:hypothetical protein
MAPIPSEIQVMNHRGEIFRARPTGIRPSQGAHQYRIQLPNVEFSLIVVTVTENELRDHVQTGFPVQIRVMP